MFSVSLSLPLSLRVWLALLSDFLSHFVSLFCHSRLGGERDLLLTSTHHGAAHIFPAPSPEQPTLAPHFVLWGEGPSLPVALLSPCGPASSPTPWLPPTFPSLLPLAGFSPPTAPASLPPFSVSLPSLPHDPALYSLPGLFFTPLSPAPWLMPFPVLILNSYQIYQWGERSCVLLCLPASAGGRRGTRCQCPGLGGSHGSPRQSVYLLGVPQNFPWCRIMDFGF